MMGGAPKPTLKSRLLDKLSENLAYKIVALVVTLILWFTIQGRKDTVATRDMRLEYIVPERVLLVEPTARSIKVRVAGPRPSLKKFMQSEEAVTIDLNGLGYGDHRLEVDESRISLPVGLKVVSVSPKLVTVRMRSPQEPPSGESGNVREKRTNKK